MKNQYRLFLFFLTITLVGCQKSEVIKPEIDGEITIETLNSLFDFNVKVQNGMLVFPTRDDYESALVHLGSQDGKGFEKWEAALDFVSMRASLEESEREKIGIVDDLLAALINKKGQIEIADNVFTLNALEETVVATPSNSFSEYGKSAKNSTIYSTDDNILDIIEGNDTRLSTAERARYCSKNKQDDGDQGNSIPSILVKAKVVYQKAGFLNSLQSKILQVRGLVRENDVNFLNIKLKTVGNNFWRNKKHSAPIPFHESAFFDGSIKTYRPYYASRRLKDYSFSVEFIMQDKEYKGTSTGLFGDVLKISCN